MSANVWVKSGKTYNLLDAKTTTGAGTSIFKDAPITTFQAFGTTSAGSGTGVINIEVSNDNTNWLVLGTISLTLSTTTATDGFVANAPWKHVRANVTTLSGTGASVTALMGV